MSEEDMNKTEETSQSEEIEVEIEIESEQEQETAEQPVSVAQSESKSESDEELDNYSKGVKKRINKLTEKYRRAERDGQEAIELAKKLREENEKLRKQMASSQEAHLSEFGQRLEQALSRISIDQERHRLGVKRQEEQAQQPQPEPQPEPQPQQTPDPKAVAWAQKNEYFGDDKRMTDEAMHISQVLINYEGFDATSDEYYSEIDKRMRDSFPDYFSPPGRSTKVAPADTSASRKPSGRSSVQLTPSEVDKARRLNVTLEQYAKEKARLMAREN